MGAAAAAFLLTAVTACRMGEQNSEDLPPMDPQVVQDQDDMTWDDYKPIPGRNWADPSLKPERGFRLAIVAIDFPDQPFVITLPKKSDPFGNPQIDPIAREDMPQFYADFFMKPSDVNNGHTINGYWMEQSRGKFGITEVGVFGPYRMPDPLWNYGLNEYGQEDQTPDGSIADGRMEQDCDAIWIQDVGEDIRDNYDAVLRIYASYDETGVWQEFGEMKFNTKEDIPPEWGNPNPDMPRWITTRYVEWTSWLAGSQQWGLSSMRQGENSGTITHELGHFAFRLPDLNNNPYVKPNGEKVMRTIADYRQLNDALFHAGLDSGSFYEWEDTPNRLHFYVIDLHKDERGILSYTLAVRSLEGDGTRELGAALKAPEEAEINNPHTPVIFTLSNTGAAADAESALHPSDAGVHLNSDVYRLSVSMEGEGWSAQLLNGLAAVEAGQSHPVTVYVTAEESGVPPATLTLRAVSESDPAQTAEAVVTVFR